MAPLAAGTPKDRGHHAAGHRGTPMSDPDCHRVGRSTSPRIRHYPPNPLRGGGRAEAASPVDERAEAGSPVDERAEAGSPVDERAEAIPVRA